MLKLDFFNYSASFNSVGQKFGKFPSDARHLGQNNEVFIWASFGNFICDCMVL
jgi:hypothetical protein